MSLKRKCSAVVFKNSIISLNFDSHYLLLFVCFFLGIFCRWKITFSREFDDFVQYFCCSKPFCQMYSVNTIHVDKNVPSCIYEFQSSSMVLKKIFQRIFQRIFKILLKQEKVCSGGGGHRTRVHSTHKFEYTCWSDFLLIANYIPMCG